MPITFRTFEKQLAGRGRAEGMVVRKARRAGILVAQLCRKYQINESQFYKWTKDFKRAQRFKTYIGTGVAFFNMQNQMKVKGSDLGKKYSLQNLEKRLGWRCRKL